MLEGEGDEGEKEKGGSDSVRKEKPHHERKNIDTNVSMFSV